MGSKSLAAGRGGILIGAPALLVVAAGLACLNDTQPGGLEGHGAWAREHELPAPSRAIHSTGAGLVGGGALALGLARGRGRRSA